MFSGTFINVGMAPGVIGDFAFHIGTLPTLGVTRLLHEIKQAVFPLRIITIVDFKGVESSAEGRNLRLSGGLTGLFRASGEFRNHDGGKNSQNHEDEKKFDQGKPPVSEASGGFASRIAGSNLDLNMDRMKPIWTWFSRAGRGSG